MKNIRYVSNFENNVTVDFSEPENYEKTKAALKLMSELQKGRLSGEQKGWLSEEDVEEHYSTVL